MTVRYAALAKDKDGLREFGQWMGKRTGLDPAYISHGEIQTGLSLDGVTWRADLETVAGEAATELALPDSPRQAFEAVDLNGVRVAGAVVLWLEEEPAPYAVLEDLVVEPAERGRGIAAGLLQFIETQARERGIEWLFLESGLRNGSAHRFFEGRGFAPISKVFSKRLGQGPRHE
jgi:GNAT superfamily N-acetyltransferase